MGAIMAAGILDAGGRNATLALRSGSGHFRRTSVVGLAVFTGYWYWYPLRCVSECVHVAHVSFVLWTCVRLSVLSNSGRQHTTCCLGGQPPPPASPVVSLLAQSPHASRPPLPPSLSATF